MSNKSNTTKWKPDFAKTWCKIELEAYKLIYTEAKEKMEDSLQKAKQIEKLKQMYDEDKK